MKGIDTLEPANIIVKAPLVLVRGKKTPRLPLRRAEYDNRVQSREGE
jgi:hypothetical protein